MNRTVSAAIPDGRLSRRAAVGRLTGAGAAAVIAAMHRGRSRGAAQAAAQRTRSSVVTTQEGTIMTDATPTAATPLTVVLVHGAFADASGWTGVIERLQGVGITVTAPPNPLRGVAHDSAYIASLLNQIPGPVVLVGHSYGGVVISNAATNATNVVGLVYVAAFAPDDGETLLELAGNSRDSVLITALLPLQYPTGPGTETAVEFAINPEHYHEAFAADLPMEQTVVMAAAQRPAAELAFSETSGPPAWKSLPSWAVVPTGDKAAGTDVVRFLAERAGATITEVEGSHAIMISQPQAITDVILTAIDTVAAVGAAA
jgi:pimeloyl-ACP methyl ester carboxylesterase